MAANHLVGINTTTGFFRASEVGDFTVTGTHVETNVSGTASVHVIPTNVDRQEKNPTEFTLFQNYPNPFNPETVIEFSVKEKCNIVLSIYNVRGREVKRLINAPYQPGYFKVTFNASGLPSGIYFYKIQMKEYSDVKKMVVLE